MGGGVGKEKDKDRGSPSMALEALRDWGAARPRRPQLTLLPGIVQPKKAINVMEASAADLVKVQRRALKEYPFLVSVYESVLITDALAPDNPMCGYDAPHPIDARAAAP